MENLGTNYTLIVGNKHMRAKIYKFEDFYYVKGSKKGTRVYMKCQKTSSDKTACRGSARLDTATDEMTAGQPHNHTPEDYTFELELKKELKRRCEDNITNERRSDIFRNTVRGHEDAAKVSFRYDTFL